MVANARPADLLTPTYIPGGSARGRRKVRAGRANLGENRLPAAAASQRGDSRQDGGKFEPAGAIASRI
jgi:hypothetical protein